MVTFVSHCLRWLLRLDWSVEWVTVAAPGNAARAMAHGEPMPELPGLFA